jgi:hypothetical protein
MKVYSWKTLAATILIGGGMLTYELKNIITKGEFDILSIVFWGYLTIKGFWVSLTREGFEEDKLMANINEIVMKDLFGKWSTVVRYGGFVFLILAIVSLNFIPSQIWITILFFIIALLYHIIISNLIRNRIKLERRKYF